MEPLPQAAAGRCRACEAGAAPIAILAVPAALTFVAGVGIRAEGPTAQASRIAHRAARGRVRTRRRGGDRLRTRRRHRRDRVFGRRGARLRRHGRARRVVHRGRAAGPRARARRRAPVLAGAARGARRRAGDRALTSARRRTAQRPVSIAVDVAVASSAPDGSCRLASRNATRRPIRWTRPSATTRPGPTRCRKLTFSSRLATPTS